MSKRRIFPMYHWSPRSRRNGILKQGLVPGCWSKDRLWKAPYICFSDSPSLAWSLSGMRSGIYGEWDLWMIWSNVLPHYKTLTTTHNPSGQPSEYRTFQRVYKRNVWYVGSRIYIERSRDGR